MGIKRVNRARAQNSLDMYRASLMAGAKPEDRREWIDEQETIAGYKHNG